MTSATQAAGASAEDRVLGRLQTLGLRLIARNFRCRLGELDLILADGETLVITEVRYRGRRSHGGAAASVGRRKQARMAAATRVFLSRHPELQRWPVRFDVVAVDGNRWQWIKRAFDAPPI